MSCPRCDGPSRTGLCMECEIELDHEFFASRAEEVVDQEEEDDD
jgi:hypothetical protein